MVDFDSFYQRPLPVPPESKRILVISADGKGISMHNKDLREGTRKMMEREAGKPKKARLQPGEKKGRKRMSTVVAVYEVDPYFRTPEQILHLDGEEEPPRPKPANKRVWADVEEDMSGVIEQGFLEAMRRDPEQKMDWVVLVDGQTDLIRQVEKQAEKYKVQITITQDLIHVIGYLWKAVHALHPEDADVRESWIRKRTLDLLQGKAENVPSGLRRAATPAGPSDNERKPIDTAANYIEKSVERLRYDLSLTKGLPIAPGVIEGACRNLVKDRMDLTGARWRLKAADAVLKLRSLKISGDLPSYLAFHFETEQFRNYPAAEWVDRFSEAA